MRSREDVLRACVALALRMPSDRRLAVALSSLPSHDSSTPHRAIADPGYAPAFGSSAPSDDEADPESLRLRALVDLAREGDAEAFGQLYDHYVTGIFRFIYYRVGSRQLAEDLTSETFVRSLRSIQKFSWQGKDFGAWLTTIARNLVTDHFKSSRARLEVVSDQMPERRDTVDSPEADVMTAISHEMLHAAVESLPAEQRDCILMRFIQGLSIAQTAAALGRTEGAIKQLQLRAVRNLAKQMPADIR